MKKWAKANTNQPARRRQSVVSNATPSQSPVADRSAFRRNSTITGSTSSQIRGVGESSSHLKSDRVHAHDLTQKRRRIGTGFGLVVSVAIGLLIIILQFTAESHVAINGVNKAVDSTDYIVAVNDYLSRRPVERLRFALDEASLVSFMQAKHPEIQDLKSHSGNGFGSSEFTFTVRKPVAVWTIEDNKFFVDQRGVSFTLNHHDTPSISIVDESGVPAEAGVSIASNRFLSYVGQTIAAFRENGKVISQVVIPPSTTRQIEVLVEGGEYPIKLSIDRAVGEQAEDASRAIDYISANGRAVAYVDVRVAGKAFYRE